MRVAILGGTGFVGGYLVDALVDRGHRPVLLVRPGSERKVRHPEACDTVPGDVDHLGDIVKLLNNSDAAIYNIGILREAKSRGVTYEALQYEGVVRLIEAADACGVARLLLMSANGVRPGGTPYQDTKFRAEERALRSTMRVTVFRPSVIFGDPRGGMEFATQLYRDMVAPPMPAVGFYNAWGRRRGEFAMSPVHVEDVAEAFARALEDDTTIGRTICLAGPEDLTWRQMLTRIAAAGRKDKWIVPMPVELMRAAATLLDWLPLFPVTRDQLAMLAEGNTAGAAELAGLLGHEPRAFDADTLGYLAG